MISKITICNLALAQLGQAPISSLEQDDERARRLNLFYEPVRDEVLRTHNWGFAGAEEPLIFIENDSADTARFLYKYPTEAVLKKFASEPFPIKAARSLSKCQCVCPVKSAALGCFLKIVLNRATSDSFNPSHV